MKILLKQFEQIINETILKRGLSYFKKGYVSDFTEISNGEYEAAVSGTEEYTVRLKIKNDIIEEHYCDCPYDMGPVCKHIVAVIFYLQKDVLELDKKVASKPRKKRTKSVTKQVHEILKMVSHNDLISFIEENSKSDRNFRTAFLASFGHLSQNQSKEFYQKQIKSILKTAAGRDGWIAWSDMKYVVNTIEPFLKNAEKYLANNNFENVFFISSALLEEMTEALQYGDDSNGDLGYFIESSIELLTKIAQEKLPKMLKEEIFEYCISTFNKGLFSGWDWHLEMLHIACELAEKESDSSTILNCLDTIEGEYEQEQAQFYKLKLLRQFKDETEVENYIKKHISNSSIRNDEIEKAFESKYFEKAIKLSKEGIKYDEKDKPGLVKDWYNWLLKIAQVQNNTRNIIENARFLFIDNFYPEQDYYQILKQEVEPNKWKDFLEEIIKEITPKGSWTYDELVRKIYINEKWWDRLFLLLKQNASLHNIENNEKYLSKDYSQELIQLYSERLVKYIEEYVGRNHYQTACRYLRRMKKLGATGQVSVLIETFRKEYPQRRALMDELNQV